MDTDTSFETDHFVVVRSIIDPLLTKFLTVYFQQLRESKKAEGARDWTSLNALADPVGDTVLYSIRPKIEEAIGLSVLPTFSIVRMYSKGDRLGHHKDGPANEIGVTLCVDRDIDWPLYVDDFKQKHAILLDPGDAVIYKGNQLEHWRDRYKGDTQSQLLMGFVRADGEYADRAMYAQGTPISRPGTLQKSSMRRLLIGRLARVREVYRNMKIRARGGL